MPSTKAFTTHGDGPETLQAWRVPMPSKQWKAMTGAIIDSCNLTRYARTDTQTLATDHCVLYRTPKALEAERQIERLRLARELAEQRADEPSNVEGVVSSVQILQRLTSGPIPIPVASWDPEGGASLFFDEDGFYGDLEICGKTIEYLLKWSDNGGEVEVFDTEAIEDGKIPPRLLIHLFGRFARSDAEVL